MVTQATQVRRYKHLIGGEWVDASSGETIPRNNPATGEMVAEFAAGTLEDTRKAVEAARAAFDTSFSSSTCPAMRWLSRSTGATRDSTV